jgi:hypothetical protein
MRKEEGRRPQQEEAEYSILPSSTTEFPACGMYASLFVISNACAVYKNKGRDQA